jgi:hypothetical protein
MSRRAVARRATHQRPRNLHQTTPTVIQMRRLAPDAIKPTRHQVPCVT